MNSVSHIRVQSTLFPLLQGCLYETTISPDDCSSESTHSLLLLKHYAHGHQTNLSSLYFQCLQDKAWTTHQHSGSFTIQPTSRCSTSLTQTLHSHIHAWSVPVYLLTSPAPFLFCLSSISSIFRAQLKLHLFLYAFLNYPSLRWCCLLLKINT